MRIVQVVHWFLPQHAAGSEVYTASLSLELARRHEVSVFCREDGHPEARFHEEDVAYQGLPVHRVYYSAPTGPLALAARALARFRNTRIERSFACFLERVRPDVVHFQHLFKLSGSLIRIAQEMGIPAVVTLHDYWFLCYNGQLLRPGLRNCAGPLGGVKCPGCAELPIPRRFLPFLYPAIWPLMVYRTWFLRRRLLRADAIISPSGYLAKVFCRHGFEGRILVSDNGTETAWARQVRHVPSDKVRFGYIGTLAPHKGAHLLLEAHSGMDATRSEVRIHGRPGADVGYADSLRAMAGSDVRFMGAFERDQLAQVLSELDVLVVPSVWAENSPVTIHEARMAQVPVIAAEAGGMPDLVTGGRAGWLFPPGDAVALRRLMQGIVADPGQLAAVREGILPVKTIEEQATELEALYETLRARTAGGSAGAVSR